MKKTLYISLTVLVSACSSPTETTPAAETAPGLKEQLTGTWSNTYLRTELKGVNPGDSVVVNEVTEAEWTQKLGIKPIVTTFKEDGTFESKYYNLQDSLVRNPSGTWTIVGDTLVMTELVPDTAEFRLHLSFGTYSDGKTALAKFKGNIDFDGGGRADDAYYGEQKKHKDY